MITNPTEIAPGVWARELRERQAEAMATDDRYALVDAIVRYEEGEMTDEQIRELFQYLVSTGLAWQLQGSYGRFADRLISDGLITDPRDSAPGTKLAVYGPVVEVPQVPGQPADHYTSP